MNTFSVRKGQQLVVVEDGVQIFSPLRVHIAIENDPMSFAGFSSLIFSDLSQDSGEDAVSPFEGGVVKTTIELILGDRLGIDDVALSFDFVSSFQGVDQYLPGLGLSTTGRTDHHQTMVESLNLIELQHLLNKAFFRLQQHVLGHLNDVFSESRLPDRWDRGSWENALQEIRKKRNILSHEFWN